MKCNAPCMVIPGQCKSVLVTKSLHGNLRCLKSGLNSYSKQTKEVEQMHHVAVMYYWPSNFWLKLTSFSGELMV